MAPVGSKLAPTTPPSIRYDPFHGLFGPPPPHFAVDVMGPNNANTHDSSSSDKDIVPRKGRTVKVPFFVQHLISKPSNRHKHTIPSSTVSGPVGRPHSHPHHDQHPQQDTSSSIRGTEKGSTHDREEHDHSFFHKPSQCRQSMQIENSLCDYDAVETVNRDMRGQLNALVQQKFFKFYKVNLYGNCPFWTENHLCMNKDCGVAVIDERNIPEEWRSEALGAISSSTHGKGFQPFKSCQLKDQDFCQVDDEAISEGVYVDLMENPERFTGYSGPSAAKVWDAIYNENCFNIAQRMQQESDCEQCSLDRQADEELLAAKLRSATTTGVSLARNPVGELALGKVPAMDTDMTTTTTSQHRDMTSPVELFNPLTAAVQQDEEVCLEKRVFYRMISGLHASISIHICDEHFNQTSGVWGPNLECFVSRVGAHPDRLENIFFDYAILVRAVTKLSGYLKDYEFCTGHPDEDAQVKSMVDRLIETSAKSPAIFDEKAMFVGPGAQALKMEFRDHFRNITKIMDCVGCEKCRLWGKVQTSGLGTALKILFSYNDEHLNPIKNPNLLQRTEIVALFNTLNRLSESVESITKFREMYMQQYGSARIPTDSTWSGSADTSAGHHQQKWHSQQEQHPTAAPDPSNFEDLDTEVHQSDMSSSIQSFFSSVLSSHEASKQSRKNTSSSGSTSTAIGDTALSWTMMRLKELAIDAHEWAQMKGAGVCSLVLSMYQHPMMLLYGEQRTTTCGQVQEHTKGHARTRARESHSLGSRVASSAARQEDDQP
ncbi:hypothetical protein EDD11_003515 [Mortierella claussenii]|nr:hypothetical protein EDD11_003515 [Mortierella claussenii]